MALIQDPDFLNQGIEVVFDTVAKTVQLVAIGNLTTDGVTLQALYSFAKEEWKLDANLIKYPFPFVAITPEEFEFINGWTYADQATVDLFRNAGFAVKNADGTSAEEFIGLITLGGIGAGDQIYIQQSIGGTATNLMLTGAGNQCVKVYGDATHGNFDYRNYMKVFVREQAKVYGTSSHIDIGVSTFTYQAYRFPLANSADLKVTNNDTTVDVYGITIDYSATVQRNIGGTNYNFDVVINGNNRTKTEIYEAVQSALRKGTDIDNGIGTVIGKTADILLKFVGDTLVTSTGVYIDNFQSVDTNSIEFYDNTGTKRTFPFVAVGTISFNSNLVIDGSAIYKMYYTIGFGTAGATLVNDNTATAIEGTITGSSVAFNYAYDNDIAGGGAGIDKDVTVVAIGLNSAQYVVATATITKSNANSVSLVSSLERNYANPI